MLGSKERAFQEWKRSGIRLGQGLEQRREDFETEGYVCMKEPWKRC